MNNTWKLPSMPNPYDYQGRVINDESQGGMDIKIELYFDAPNPFYLMRNMMDNSFFCEDASYVIFLLSNQ